MADEAGSEGLRYLLGSEELEMSIKSRSVVDDCVRTYDSESSDRTNGQ